MIFAIIHESRFVKIGLAGLLIGLGFIVYSAIAVPSARSSLQTVEATLVGVARSVPTGRRSGPTPPTLYELALRPGPGGEEEIRLTIPSTEVASADIRAAMGKRVRAEFRSSDDVYALSSGDRQIIVYERTVERRRQEYRQHQWTGLAIMAVSFVVLLLAGGLTWYRLGRR